MGQDFYQIAAQQCIDMAIDGFSDMFIFLIICVLSFALAFYFFKKELNDFEHCRYIFVIIITSCAGFIFGILSLSCYCDYSQAVKHPEFFVIKRLGVNRESHTSHEPIHIHVRRR